MMDVVNKILEEEQRKAEKYKPITVEKHLDVEIDVGSLLVYDSNEIERKQISSDKERYLEVLTRDNTQLLCNRVWQLQTERVEEALVVRLPAASTRLPRAKPVPRPRPLTKWQEFAKTKGITKKKKSKLQWDEQLQKWVPLFGYKKAAAEKEKNWLIEVPQNVDPMTDMFEKRAAVRTEKVAKNELQRLRNVARARRVALPRVGLPATSDLASAKQLGVAAAVAHGSTASMGKFQPRLAGERAGAGGAGARARGLAELVPGRSARGGAGRAPHPAPPQERARNLALLDTVLARRVDKQPAPAPATHTSAHQLRAEEKASERGGGGGGGRAQARKGKGRGGGSSGGGGGKAKGSGKGVGAPSKAISKKPRGGRGQRAQRAQRGRKRR